MTTATLSLELTVAAIVCRADQFLMVEELVGNRKVINQPAGHVEPGEGPYEAVIRETLEESAWHFVPEAIAGIYLWQHPLKGKSFLRVAFCGHCTLHEPERSLDDGIIRTLWLSRQRLIEKSDRLRSPMVMRSIDDYLHGVRLPCDTIQSMPVNELAARAAVIRAMP